MNLLDCVLLFRVSDNQALWGYSSGNFAKSIHKRLQVPDPSHPVALNEFG